jgi:hypothetical protein
MGASMRNIEDNHPMSCLLFRREAALTSDADQLSQVHSTMFIRPQADVFGGWSSFRLAGRETSSMIRRATESGVAIFNVTKEILITTLVPQGRSPMKTLPHFRTVCVVFLHLCCLLLGRSTHAQVNVTTYHHDNARTGSAISTRRFFARPSSLPLSAMGLVFP